MTSKRRPTTCFKQSKQKIFMVFNFVNCKITIITVFYEWTGYLYKTTYAWNLTEAFLIETQFFLIRAPNTVTIITKNLTGEWMFLQELSCPTSLYEMIGYFGKRRIEQGWIVMHNKNVLLYKLDFSQFQRRTRIRQVLFHVKRVLWDFQG